MNRGITLSAAILLVVGGAIALFRESSESEETGASSGVASGSRASGMNKSREGRSRRATPADAERSLRSFLGASNKNPPTFEKLEGLARLASTEDLWQLIRDSRDGEGGPLGNPALTVNGWLRAAAFAELGRREPEQTLAELSGPNSSVADNVYDGSEQYPLLFPALFSVFRGWGEVDPAAAAARLATTTATSALENMYLENEEWKSEAYEEIFARWASRDIDDALGHLPPGAMRSYRMRALAGLIAGVNDLRRVSEFQALARREYDAKSQLNVSFDVPVSGFEFVDLEGFALMNRLEARVVDREAATNELAAIVDIANRGAGQSGFVSDTESGQLFRFGLKSPGEAITFLGEDNQALNALAQGVLLAHPERAIEVVDALNANQHSRVLRGAVRQARTFSTAGWYPGPDRFTRLSDTGYTEQHFEAAIEAATLTAAQRRKLHELLAGDPDPAPVPEPQPEPEMEPNFVEPR